MGAGRNSQKKRTVGKAVKPESGYRGCTVPPDQHHLVFPAPYFGSIPRSPFLRVRLNLERRFFNRRVTQSYLSLRNSAVKRTQRNYSRAKYSGYTRGVKPGLLTQADVFPRLQADLEILGAPPDLVRAI
jgi:hypothetical protein